MVSVTNEKELFQLDENLKKSLHFNNYVKCKDLALSRIYGKELDAFNFYMAWLFIVTDIQKGQDGYTGELIEKHFFTISLNEILNFATYYKGKAFSEEVRNMFNKMCYDEDEVYFLN
jgi:hypothetical protein